MGAVRCRHYREGYLESIYEWFGYFFPADQIVCYLVSRAAIKNVKSRTTGARFGGIMDKMKTVGYEPLVNDIKEMIHKKHYHAMKALNAETILLYWEIGEEIF